MLHSLEIRNYRNLPHLRIMRLCRVNLLSGMNSTGKTAVLEAIAIYASTRNELPTIKSLLQRRGEYATNLTNSLTFTENILTSISALFTDYEIQYFESNGDSGIYIGEQQEKRDYLQSSLRINLRKAYKTVQGDQSGRQFYEYVVAEKEEDIEQRDFRYEIKFRRNTLRETTYELNNESVFMDKERGPVGAPAQFQYIDSKNQTQQTVEALYGRIALSSKEDEVIEALKIIEPRSERFSLIENNKPIIKLSDGKIRALSSMGDGVSRVFTIILSMVNCEGTYLLIDEFENGLHYSVQEKLWRIIFSLAESLDIQVFATTHSNDAIKAFEAVANTKSSYQDAQLIKLRTIKGNTSAVIFNAQELQIVNESDYLEVR